MNPRIIATKSLVEVIRDGRSLRAVLAKLPQNIPEPALVKELCYGVLRWYFQLDAIVKHLLPKPLKAKDTDVAVLLYIGLYQLLFLRTAPYASVDQTVAACKTLKPWASGLVNAILRRYLREKPEIQTEVAQFSHPQWLIESIQQNWPDHWEAIFQANNQYPPQTLRINTQKIALATYQERLTALGIETHLSADAPQALTLAKPQSVMQLPGFQAGEFAVQDLAAHLAAPLLEVMAGHTVLDACAAPGGKTLHIAELAPSAHIVAIDSDAARLEKAKENQQRLLPQALIEWQAIEGIQFARTWKGPLFDRILLDAPCSATGVIRRHPDIKLLRKPEDIATLATQQGALLRAVWSLLKPGGRLLYVTCSILPQENEAVIVDFLAHQADAQEQRLVVEWGMERSAGRQILPGQDNMDGFYYACLSKK
ncbi:MAG: 16S rRNA (cytosine(967)-C(5))-methyltransferase RsmB [Gammaproteobacteria bacterium]